jgi:hypothetical protein
MSTSNYAVFYDATGKVVFTTSNVTTLSSTPPNASMLLVSKAVFEALLPGREFVRNGEIATQPRQPSPAHEWDLPSFSWIPNLALAKYQANSRITFARNKAENAGFEAYGKVFDSDAKAVQRISVAVQAAQAVGEPFSINWTCADNSVIALGYTEMMSLPAIMAQAADTLHIRARLLKTQIASATTVEEIDSVVW